MPRYVLALRSYRSCAERDRVRSGPASCEGSPRLMKSGLAKGRPTQASDGGFG